MNSYLSASTARFTSQENMRSLPHRRGTLSIQPGNELDSTTQKSTVHIQHESCQPSIRLRIETADGANSSSPSKIDQHFCMDTACLICIITRYEHLLRIQIIRCWLVTMSLETGLRLCRPRESTIFIALLQGRLKLLIMASSKAPAAMIKDHLSMVRRVGVERLRLWYGWAGQAARRYHHSFFESRFRRLILLNVMGRPLVLWGLWAYGLLGILFSRLHCIAFS